MILPTAIENRRPSNFMCCHKNLQINARIEFLSVIKTLILIEIKRGRKYLNDESLFPIVRNTKI
jgi:methyltransferase-like protein